MFSIDKKIPKCYSNGKLEQRLSYNNGVFEVTVVDDF